MPGLTATLVGGPTAILELGGLRLLTDPTFDPPGEQPRGLVKLAGPALGPDEVGDIDAVLLSHDHHPDNLDTAGVAFLPRAGQVLTTAAAAERLGGNAVGLEPWESAELDGITVTAVPALHGPEGSDPVMGPVIGFYLTGDQIPTVYVSGDNASVDLVRVIVARLGKPELSVLFAGGASIPARFDGACLTLSSELAVEAARVLGSRAIVPVHFDGWQHFSSDGASLRAAFTDAGLGDVLAFAEPGQTVSR
jgi:L-ascorbate metabolism protein UlaG (beta-lactamase superfamily)